jgi:hypothetical protein
MMFKIKKSNDRVVYLPSTINCSRYRIEADNDGIIEQIKCVSRYLRRACKTCGLICHAKPHRRKKD